MIRLKVFFVISAIFIFVSSSSFISFAAYDDRSHESDSDTNEDEEAPEVFNDIEKSMAYGVWLNEKLLETVGDVPSFDVVYEFLDSDQCMVNVFVGENEPSISTKDGVIFITMNMLDEKDPDSQDFIDKERENHEEYNYPENMTVKDYNVLWMAHYTYYAAFLCIEMNNRDEIAEDLITENRTGIECQVMGHDNIYRMILWEKQYDSDDTSYLRTYLYDTPDYFVKCFPEFEYGYK